MVLLSGFGSSNPCIKCRRDVIDNFSVRCVEAIEDGRNCLVFSGSSVAVPVTATQEYQISAYWQVVTESSWSCRRFECSKALNVVRLTADEGWAGCFHGLDAESDARRWFSDPSEQWLRGWIREYASMEERSSRFAGFAALVTGSLQRREREWFMMANCVCSVLINNDSTSVRRQVF